MASSYSASADVNEVYDERFEEIYNSDENIIELMDNGRTCTSIRRGSFGCTLGHNAYLSGVHRIRLRLDYGIASLGIHCRNMPLVSSEFGAGSYDSNPSIHGWGTGGSRIVNGRYEGDVFTKTKERLIQFVLVLNCDDHRLSMLNENTNERDEMEVNIANAPFPWCLFVQISRFGGRVSLVYPLSLTFKSTPADATLLRNLTVKTLDHEIIDDNNSSDTTNTIATQFMSTLELWRQEAYQRIDQYCDEKREEFIGLLNQQRTKPKPVNIQSIFSSLTFNRDLVHFRSNRLVSKAILPFQIQGASSLLEQNHGCIAANENHFVIIQANSLWIYKHEWPPLRSLQWTYGNIYDMFWCHALDQFILISEQKILLFNDKTMTLSPLSLNENQTTIDFYGGTCIENMLFFFTWGWGSCIYVYAIRPLLELQRTYQPPFPCTTDELIFHCASNYQALAMIIKNRHDEIRLDLCSPTNMERFWSIKLDLTVGYQHIRCCSINHNDWMIISPDSSTLTHISGEGELIGKDTHDPVPWYGLSLRNNDILILSDYMMNIYRLS
ncbi:hypothetical protein I4U23_013024 [Adineta vaga]|nr:hypothetical protein I4U23_013024 [Adineta vaga]